MNKASISAIKINDRARMGVVDRYCRKQIFRALQDLPEGLLTIEEQGRAHAFGQSHSDQLRATISVSDPTFYRSLMFGGSVGAAESYMQAHWRTPDLVAVIRLMARNINWLNKLDNSGLPVQRVTNRIYHWLTRNSESGSRRNISAHYDLSNEFFRLFLDPSMMYSAAVFPDRHCSLDAAAEHKLDLVCQKLELTASDHLLEIGTGWGGLAIYAAENYGCRVTTTTISRQQYEYACQRVKEKGLSDRVNVMLEDYRNITGQYDKLVSIEMIEAVGHKYYGTYFSKCSSLLKHNGLMVIQAITIAEQRYEQAKKSVDFIQRYIFPGGCLPSHQIITGCLGRNTDMQLTGFQEIGLDYALTLRHWRKRFLANLEEVRKLGFDDTFIRMWDYYLSYCEGGFLERAIGTSQMVFAKPGRQLTPE